MVAHEPPNLADYVDALVDGGYPTAVLLPKDERPTWLKGYVEQLVGRDVPSLAEIRDPVGLHRLLRVLAGNTARLTPIPSNPGIATA